MYHTLWSNIQRLHVLQVLDARPKGIFDGTAPDPNPKLPSGHILGSISFPFTNVVDIQNKKLKDVMNLKQCEEILYIATLSLALMLTGSMTLYK